MNRLNDPDAPRERSFLVRFLIVLPFLVLLSLNLSCAGDQQPVVDDSTEIDQFTQRLDQLEGRVQAMEGERLFYTTMNSELNTKVAELKQKLALLTETFTIVGADTPNPFDDHLYINKDVDMGPNQLQAGRVMAQYVSADMGSFIDSWVQGVAHVGMLGLKNGDVHEYYLNATDVEWIQQVSPKLHLSYNFDGSSWFSVLTDDGIHTSNVYASDQLVTSYLQASEGSYLVGDLTVGGSITANSADFAQDVTVNHDLLVKHDSRFGGSTAETAQALIGNMGMHVNGIVSMPGYLNQVKLTWLDHASQFISFVQSPDDNKWFAKVEGAKFATYGGFSAANVNQDENALTVNGDVFIAGPNGTAGHVSIYGDVSVQGTIDASCQWDIASCQSQP